MLHYHPDIALKLEVQMTEERIRRTSEPVVLETTLSTWFTLYSRQTLRQIAQGVRLLIQSLTKTHSTNVQSSPVTLGVTGRK